MLNSIRTKNSSLSFSSGNSGSWMVLSFSHTQELMALFGVPRSKIGSVGVLQIDWRQVSIKKIHFRDWRNQAKAFEDI